MACRRIRSVLRGTGIATICAALAACGGGGSGGDAASRPAESNQIGVAQSCSQNNPYRFDADSTTSAGSLSREKAWLRDYFDRQYLWYAEVPGVNAALPAFSSEGDVYGSLDAYFNALRTPALTASGARKDRFSFTYPTREWNALIDGGTLFGYGIEWFITSPQTPPRHIRVAFVHAGSQAQAQGIQRGDTLVSAGGTSADTTTAFGVDTLNAALFPGDAGAHSFTFTRQGAAFSRTLNPSRVSLDTVPIAKVVTVAAQKVGYVLFNDHLQTAEQPLIAAFTMLRDAGVNDLVLDLRYNGGGYLHIASEVAYMIAGAGRTSGRVFERLVLNAKRQAENSSLPFLATSSSGAALPTLNLGRVYVLTSRATCSASEAIVNGLRGADVDVRLIGGTTCGKPYGFYGQDNCGVSYFAVEFQGANHQGFADYADGFAPSTAAAAVHQVPGCTVADDFERALGDPSEGQLATALALIATGICPSVAVGRASPLAATSPTAGALAQSPLRVNRYLGAPRR
jgi:carboxyl-terminal processing protease